VSPELRKRLASAKRLTLLGSEKWDVYFAEYLDKHGAYVAEVEEPPKGATPTQRRRAMQTLCAKRDRPDLVMSTSSGDSDAGGIATAKALVLGREEHNITTTVDVIGCRDSWPSQFTARVEFSQGLLNMDATRIEQTVGHEFAKTLMRLAGKPLPAGQAIK
jgi:hypothetical protein